MFIVNLSSELWKKALLIEHKAFSFAEGKYIPPLFFVIVPNLTKFFSFFYHFDEERNREGNAVGVRKTGENMGSWRQELRRGEWVKRRKEAERIGKMEKQGIEKREKRKENWENGEGRE